MTLIIILILIGLILLVAEFLIIPGVTVACEGATLLVAPKDDAELAEVTAKLADFGVEPFPNSCVPAEYREAVYVFVAPPKTRFEEYDGTPEGPTGQPKAISTHGLKPGMPGDDRFAIFAGPDVPQGSLAQADATQVAPTLAKLLGLSVESYPTQALF